MVRFGWCAEEICFKSPLLALFFRLGKVMPIVRGKGLQQPGFEEAMQRVRDGDWLHVFPEGELEL